MIEIHTYRDLFLALGQLSDDQMAQPIQVAGTDQNDIVELIPCLAIGTVEEFSFTGCRSVVDNKYHAEEVVFITDRNPHSENGATMYRFLGNGMIPIYPNGMERRKRRINILLTQGRVFIDEETKTA